MESLGEGFFIVFSKLEDLRICCVYNRFFKVRVLFWGTYFFIGFRENILCDGLKLDMIKCYNWKYFVYREEFFGGREM